MVRRKFGQPTAGCGRRVRRGRRTGDRSGRWRSARRPHFRELGEQQGVQAADRLIANTSAEADELARLYDADPYREDVVHPGVDLQSSGRRASRPRARPDRESRMPDRRPDGRVRSRHRDLAAGRRPGRRRCADVGASRVAQFLPASTPPLWLLRRRSLRRCDRRGRHLVGRTTDDSRAHAAERLVVVGAG